MHPHEKAQQQRAAKQAAQAARSARLEKHSAKDGGQGFVSPPGTVPPPAGNSPTAPYLGDSWWKQLDDFVRRNPDKIIMGRKTAERYAAGVVVGWKLGEKILGHEVSLQDAWDKMMRDLGYPPIIVPDGDESVDDWWYPDEVITPEERRWNLPGYDFENPNWPFPKPLDFRDWDFGKFFTYPDINTSDPLDPENYIIPGHSFYTPCVDRGCNYTGLKYASFSQDNGICLPTSEPCSSTSNFGHVSFAPLYATPWEAYQAGGHIGVFVLNPNVSGNQAYRLGGIFVDPMDPDPALESSWELQGVNYPGWGTPLMPAHTEFPELFPVTAPIQTPTPQRWADATQEPGSQPRTRQKGRFRTKPDVPPLAPLPVVTVQPAPGTVPRPPDQVIEVSPSASGTGNIGRRFTKPNSARQRPPAKRTKERKYTIRSVAGRALVAINFLTEAEDFIDSVWKALPKECKSKGRRVRFARKRDGKKFWGNAPTDPLTKLGDLYRCFEHLDADTAIANYFNNQMEDMFYGTLGSAVGRASGVIGVTTGLDHAIREAEKGIAEASQTQGQEAPRIELPEVRYDTETQNWVLDLPDWLGGGSFAR